MGIVIGILSLAALVFLCCRETRDEKLLKTVTRRNRGTRTERDLVVKLLKAGIPAQTIFHDLYVQKRDGTFSQIDLVVATKVGILVFEVKECSGWIFGASHHREWTQVLAFGKRKYRFYNPILQNRNHLVELKKQRSQLETVPFYSIIVFYGHCVLKDIQWIPEEIGVVKADRAVAWTKTLMENKEHARYTNKHEIVNLLKEAVKRGEDKDVQAQHINNVRKMLGKER